MKPLLNAIAVALACIGVAHSAEAPDFLGELSGLSCAQWLEYHSTSDERRNTPMNAWAYGMLRGQIGFGAARKGKMKVSSPAPRDVGAYVNKYCRAEPSKTPASAVDQLYGELLAEVDNPTKNSDSK